MTRLFTELRNIYCGSSRDVARAYVSHLENYEGRAAAAVRAIETTVLVPIEITNELFDTSASELKRARKTGGTIEWLAVGDPCFHVLVPARGVRSVVPSRLEEYAHANRLPRVRAVAYEVWISRLLPLYADNWYSVEYHLAARTYTYAPLPENRMPRIARQVRRALEQPHVRCSLLPRAVCARSVACVPEGLRRSHVTVFELLFSSVGASRLRFFARGYESKMLRFGSTFGPPGRDDPGALAIAFPTIGASWREEYTSDGKLASGELDICVPAGIRVNLRRLSRSSPK